MVQETLTGKIEKTNKIELTPKDWTIGDADGFYFDIIQEHSVSIQNQITDNYLENGRAVGDHIAHSPITVTLRGLAGEVVYAPPAQFWNAITDNVTKVIPNVVFDKLGAIPALFPPVDNVTQMAKDAVAIVETNYKKYEKIFKDLFSKGQDKSILQTRLQEIYSKLVMMSDSHAAFDVVTPYTTFSNMYIQSITMSQGDANFITDIEVTLKQVNFSEVKTTAANKEVLAKYNEMAKSKEVDHGKAQGIQENVSIIRGWYK